jgi:pSer/pThr/pTyr-binding forkhead associated (FHA) protein
MAILRRINSTDQSAFLINGDMTLVGRSETCDVAVPGHSEVSREHCGVRQYSDGVITVDDLGSKNGTHINGVRIFEETKLTEGDVIRLSKHVEFVFETGIPSASPDHQNPGEMTVNENEKPKDPKKRPTIVQQDVSSAMGKMEKELENKSFKSLMAELAAQAKPTPAKAKKAAPKKPASPKKPAPPKPENDEDAGFW